MRRVRGVFLWFAIAGVAMAGVGQAAQGPKTRAAAPAASSGTRYFQLTMVLRSSSSPEASPAPVAGPESITTEVAVVPGRTGSSKTRMGSKVAVPMGGKTEFIDVGTSLDCNDVHLDGEDLAFSMVLEASQIGRMLRYRNAAGAEVEEPLITQRKIELQVKLPLGVSKVVFDSKNPPQNLGMLKPLKPLGDGSGGAPPPPAGMQVEMTATEVK